MGTQPRPPLGFSSLPVSSAQILLPLTVSNKCGQSFRWRAVEVYEPVQQEYHLIKAENHDEGTSIKQEDGSEPHLLEKESSKAIFSKTIEWSFCLPDRVVFARQDEEKGFIYHRTQVASGKQHVSSKELAEETAAWLSDYLNLQVPLAELYEEWSSKDDVFQRFAKRFTGVRMLRQDPWECLCAFICSSNNNIARIGQMVQNLCTHFSEPLLTLSYPPAPKEIFQGDDEVQLAPTTITYYPFPSPARLAQPDVEDKLRELSFGYRARYIAETANMLMAKVRRQEDEEEQSAIPKYESVDEYLHSLRTMKYEDARQELLQFPGIGPKVADCILLMSMDQPSSIPVDRHVFQFAERWYRIKTKGGLKGYEIIADKFRDLWGPYAGWAHSVLFTADLRAFASYKKEEEVIQLKIGSDEVTLKEAKNLILPVKPPIKEEKEDPIFHANGRQARRQQKRSIEQSSESISQTFKGIKRQSHHAALKPR